MVKYLSSYPSNHDLTGRLRMAWSMTAGLLVVWHSWAVFLRRDTDIQSQLYFTKRRRTDRWDNGGGECLIFFSSFDREIFIEWILGHFRKIHYLWLKLVIPPHPCTSLPKARNSLDQQLLNPWGQGKIFCLPACFCEILESGTWRSTVTLQR